MTTPMLVPTSSPPPDIIDRLCAQWKKAITSLSDDATVVSNLAALAHHAEGNPKVAHKTAQRLRALEAYASSLEDQVVLLQHVHAEEEQALHDLQVMSQQADEHHELLVSMWNSIQVSSEKENHLTTTVVDASAPSFAMQCHANISEVQPTTRSISPRNTGQPNAPTPSADLPSIRPSTNVVLPLLTEAELKDIPRTTRGRLSLAVINDALLEVQTVARKKSARHDRDLRARQSQLYQWKMPSAASHRADAAIEEVASRPYVEVTEQELRQSCAFFHGGEATARSCE